jgi:ubiquinone/menaquinone biosynthesis C-methylase UbiE
MRRKVTVVAVVVAAALIVAERTRADIKSEAPRLFDVLEVQPGMVVADVGAGQGELTVVLAQRVGSNGRVYATEIDRGRLGEIRSATERAHAENVTVVEGAAASTNLPDACCDAIVLREVYHHLTDPADLDASLNRSLKPGGKLAIIDFPPRKGSSLPNGVNPNRGGHGIRSTLVREELVAAGFTLAKTIDKWGDDASYLLLFRKPN